MYPLKRIPMDGPKNFRDLGGYLNSEGKITAWNKLYRADRLNSMSEADKVTFAELGIKTIVDLRSLTEQASSPDEIPDGVMYCSCPMMREEIQIGHGNSDAGGFKKSLVTGYITMLEEAPDLIARAVNTVSEGLSRGAVVFHCTAGKDRTGVLAAILLSILKVVKEDIIADYQVTHTYNEAGVNITAKKLMEQNPQAAAAVGKEMLSSEPETIREVLVRLDRIHLDTWLFHNGVKEISLSNIREAMLLSMADKKRSQLLDE